MLIGLLARCPSRKPVLTTYPASYHLPNRITTDPHPPFLCAREFGPEDGMLRTSGKLLRLPLPFEARRKCRSEETEEGGRGIEECQPLPSLFWASGFSFSRAEILQVSTPLPPKRCAHLLLTRKYPTTLICLSCFLAKRSAWPLACGPTDGISFRHLVMSSTICGAGAPLDSAA